MVSYLYIHGIHPICIYKVLDVNLGTLEKGQGIGVQVTSYSVLPMVSRRRLGFFSALGVPFSRYIDRR